MTRGPSNPGGGLAHLFGVLRHTALEGHVKVTGFSLAGVILLHYPSLAWHGMERNWTLPIAWFALTYFLIPLLHVLFVFSFMHEKRRLANERQKRGTLGDEQPWPTTRGFDTTLLLVVSGAVITFTYVTWAMTPHVLSLFCETSPSSSTLGRFWYGSTAPQLACISLAMIIDRAAGKRFTYAPCVIVGSLLLQMVVASGFLARTRWGMEPFPLRLLLLYGLSILIAALIILILFFVTLLPQRRLTEPERVVSPTRGIQFRYMKAVTVFCITSVIVFFWTLQVVNWARVAEGIEFQELIEATGHGEPGESSRLGMYGSLYHAGAAWILSIPLIVLSSTMIGLLFVQDVSRERWARVIAQHREDGANAPSPWMEKFFRALQDDFGVAVSTIMSVVYMSPLQIGIGVVVNVFFSLHLAFYTDSAPLSFLGIYPEGLPSRILLLNLWVGSALLWATPFVTGTTNLYDTLRRGLAVTVTRSMARAESHIVLAGYGALARRTIENLFRRKILGIEHYRDSWDIVLPNGDPGYLLQGLVIIDVKEESFEFMSQLDGQLKGIMRLNQFSHADGSIELGEKGLAVYALGICGDINDRQVFEASRVRYASNYICLARDELAAYSSADYLRWSTYGHRVPSVIAAQSSSVLSYLTYRSVLWPATFLHLAQVRADAVAQTIVDALVADAPNIDGRLLITGAGLEVFYVVDAILRALPPGFNDFSPVIGLLSDDSSFEKRVDVEDVAGDEHENGDGHGAAHRLHFTPHASTIVPQDDLREVTILWYDLDPTADSTILSTLDNFEPTIIVALHPNESQQLRIVKGIVQGISAWISMAEGRSVPRVVLAAETGRPGRTDNVGDAAKYYHSICRAGHPPGRIGPTKPERFIHYPRQYGSTDHKVHSLIGDSVVDVLDDPAQRVVSIVQSHSRDNPVEASLCVLSLPGALAQVMRKASGMKLSDEHDGRFEKVPLLVGTRVHVDGDNWMHIQLTATLHPAETAAHHHNDSSLVRASFLRLGDLKGTLEDELTRIFDETLTVDTPMSEREWWCRECPDMNNCPVSIMRKTDEARRSDRRKRPTPYYVRRTPLDTRPLEWMGGAAETTARMTIKSDDGTSTGSIAKLLTFLLGRMAVLPDQTDRHSPRTVNAMFLADETCQNPHFSLVTLCGNIESELPKSSRLPLDTLIIRPIGPHQHWARYFEGLVAFIARAFPEQVDQVSAHIVTAKGVPILYWLNLGSEGDCALRNHIRGVHRCERCTGILCNSCRELKAALCDVEGLALKPVSTPPVAAS